ncbi:hypothetical protein K0C01_09865 [Salinarchaeum sp. IM2453]|uniref:hypothetical protein n=1 Tax=Salinarchaeum sp. IM2453 TaxID=2862870 RepID=UPI001C834900|nr:hypothetical protein [Salinarchaeum sp. IM2453]QZA88095.1 hypothetical protein K0C01_09865 [Salinarchaeum sp. IM2453]
MSEDQSQQDVEPESSGDQMITSLPGISVTTQLSDADPEVLQDLHKKQLEFALERAEEAKEASRM